MKIPELADGEKEFILGDYDGEDGEFPNKIRIDKETIVVLEEIEEETIARFTIINEMWTEVTSLEEGQEASLGHVTIQVTKIDGEKVTFALK